MKKIKGRDDFFNFLITFRLENAEKKYSKVKKSITIPIKISVSSLDLKFHAWASQQKTKLGWDSGAKII